MTPPRDRQIPDLHVPARFELWVDGEADVYKSLTSTEVDAKLAELTHHR